MMSLRVGPWLRVFLVIIFFGSLLTQIVTPSIAHSTGEQYPEVAGLAIPYSAAAIFAIVAIQVALFAVWQLLTLISQRQLVSRQALIWIDTIIVCTASVALLSAMVAAHVAFAVRFGPPALLFSIAASVVLSITLFLFMRVLRGPLEAALAERKDQAELVEIG